MLNKLLADMLVFVHLAYVAFAIVGLLLVLLGLTFRWQWVRNLRFRVIHLVMVEVVALEGVFNIRCPFTDLEDGLRRPPQASLMAPAPAETDPWLAIVDAADDFQPVLQQLDPQVANFAEQNPVPADEPPAEDANLTFVGWLLGSILYVSVEQATLDKWYVVFGVVTLILFVAFPPRLGDWSQLGFTGMVLLWIGGVFLCSVLYDLWLSPSIRDHKPPLAMGAALVVFGFACAIAAGRDAKATAAA